MTIPNEAHLGTFSRREFTRNDYDHQNVITDWTTLIQQK
jgi:hypothetical protein